MITLLQVHHLNLPSSEEYGMNRTSLFLGKVEMNTFTEKHRLNLTFLRAISNGML